MPPTLVLKKIILWRLFIRLIWLTLFKTCSVPYTCHRIPIWNKLHLLMNDPLLKYCRRLTMKRTRTTRKLRKKMQTWSGFTAEFNFRERLLTSPRHMCSEITRETLWGNASVAVRIVYKIVTSTFDIYDLEVIILNFSFNV